jgi:hypothetical protein
MGVALFPETQLKSHNRFFIPNYFIYQTGRFHCRKEGTDLAVRKGIPHKYVDLSSLLQ